MLINLLENEEYLSILKNGLRGEKLGVNIITFSHYKSIQNYILYLNNDLVTHG